MRCELLLAAFVVTVMAQTETSSEALSVLADASSSTTSTSSYSNTMTNFLTETNSLGVVTGQPAPATLPAGLTTLVTQETVNTYQPPVATIPAALPTGLNTIYLGNTSAFIVSVDTSTTIVLGSATLSTTTSGISNGSGASTFTRTTSPLGFGQTSASTTDSSSGYEDGSSTYSAATSTSTTPNNGASGYDGTYVPGVVLGIGALLAALV